MRTGTDAWDALARLTEDPVAVCRALEVPDECDAVRSVLSSLEPKRFPDVSHLIERVRATYAPATPHREAGLLAIMYILGALRSHGTVSFRGAWFADA